MQQAQLNLLDEDPRASLELALREDRRAGIAELQRLLPSVDKVGLFVFVVYISVIIRERWSPNSQGRPGSGAAILEWPLAAPS